MAYSFHHHQPSPSCFDQLNDNDYDEYPESLSLSSSNCHSTEYHDSSPVVNPPTPSRIAMNSQLNLLSRFEDAIAPSQLSSWINASASLKTKITVLKLVPKLLLVKTRTSSNCNQKTQGSTKVKESPVVHNFIDNKQTGK